MADILPVFPLGIVVFPGESINLHIFESRYKQLINEVDARNIDFAILPYFEKREISFATTVSLESIVNKYPDGSMDITVKGIGVVKVLEFFSTMRGKLYPAAEVEFLPKFIHNLDAALNIKIVNLLSNMYDTMMISNVKVSDELKFRTTDVIHKIGLHLDQEFELLRMKDEIERSKYVLAHLEQFVPQVIAMEKLRHRAQMNGHFQPLQPPF